MKNGTRRHIIEIASELFYKNGYNSTGINEIIKESGIAKATLYNHFKSKEDLLLVYLDVKDNELIKHIKEFCNNKPMGNNRLIAVLEFLVFFFKQDNFNGCWCIRSMAEVPKENQRVRLKIKSNKKKFLDFLQQLVIENKPELSLTKQEQLGNQLYLLYEGALTESHIHDAVWPIETSIVILKDKLKG
ncbi:MAG: TetR/AcrR family transcriptional regulator [Bacteroidia bacterium]|nr:TetR/AcrR family transcriptional regulator [Bacteroidia bacterium]